MHERLLDARTASFVMRPSHSPARKDAVGDVFDGYPAAGAWDEVFEADGRPRRAVSRLVESLGGMSVEDLARRASEGDRSFLDRGITFSLSGEERPFPLDPVPRIITAGEWEVIETGVRQRVLALEALLADVYGPGRVFEDGVLPRRLIVTSRHFHREAFGVEPANGVRVHVAGIDLVRGTDGVFRVLEDNLRTPSGISYVIENRRSMARILPELFLTHRVRPVADYPERLLAALRAAAPAGVSDPTVVVLTPGVYNSAYFEHSFLARQMGVELVEGSDLRCVNGRVTMRTTEGEAPVHVVYRRVDDQFLDPVQFRPDSLLGCPGILNAARAGRVTIANAVGNGVADDKLLYTYVPDLIRYYLGEEPILPNVTTHRPEEPAALEAVLDRLDQLVVKPVDGSGGYGLLIGPQAGRRELDAMRRLLQESPRNFVVQELVQLSTVPTLVRGRMEPRHVDLRPFAVNDGRDVWVAPGGLTRVALPAGSLVVNSSQGGGSKDTWVLAEPLRRGTGRGGRTQRPSRPASIRAVGHPGPGAPVQLGPAGTDLAGQQGQQQQGLRGPKRDGSRPAQDPGGPRQDRRSDERRRGLGPC